jgi:type IV secretory pathway VirB2 component (pilin)
VFRTINKTGAIAVSVVGVAATCVSILDGKVANLLIGLFVVGSVGVMLKAAVAEIGQTMLTSIEDAYDAGKEIAEHTADVLDLALKRHR